MIQHAPNVRANSRCPYLVIAPAGETTAAAVLSSHTKYGQTVVSIGSPSFSFFCYQCQDTGPKIGKNS